MFRNLNEVVAMARQRGPVRIAVAAAQDPDVIEALGAAREMGLAECILVGNAEKIRLLASQAKVYIPEEQIVHEPDDVAAARKAIGFVREGRASLLMKGKIGTSTLIKQVIDRETGLRGSRYLSQVVVFQTPAMDRLMLLTDAAINILPDLEKKADICRNAIEVAHALGIANPNVALLSALELVNPHMPSTLDAAALTLMNRRGQIQGAYLEGPIALDVPLSRFAADRKGVESPLTENTDILIAPNIEAANILYRAILYFAGAESGGIVMGGRVPLILLSRAETPATKIRSIALAILAAGNR
ncbi:MAG: bifunctional enoyl-CoA hydratase/phosphate acetyltransferase [Acidobacteria bacterium]|nr:bifunctional enoyl-CoA hydratase/phosphate acetyltransferase [Acidobacteriota bacterium]